MQTQMSPNRSKNQPILESRKQRRNNKSMRRYDLQPTYFAAFSTHWEFTLVESTVNGRVISLKTKPQFPPDLLHLSGVVNHVFRGNCSTSSFHACPTMATTFIPLLLYTPPSPMHRNDNPYIRKCFSYIKLSYPPPLPPPIIPRDDI